MTVSEKREAAEEIVTFCEAMGPDTVAKMPDSILRDFMEWIEKNSPID